jgi:hypothetical protein
MAGAGHNLLSANFGEFLFRALRCITTDTVHVDSFQIHRYMLLILELGSTEWKESDMTTLILVVIGLVSGLVGGLAALCIRLITPGQTFLTPPSGLNPPWRQAMSFLTYSADLILGAIAGLVVLGVGGIDTSDPVKVIGTCVVAGVGGSGFLTNLGSKAQAGTDQATADAKLDQTTSLLQAANNAAVDAHQQVQESLEQQGSVPADIANQLSDNLASIQAVAQSSPEVTPP